MKIGVIGAGVMGSGITQVCALEQARAHVTIGRFGLDAAVARGKVTRDQADDALARITFATSFEDGAATDRPDRVIGWHWASPAPVMKLAEIVVTPETSDSTIARVIDAATRCGKRPIVVKENPMQWGFIANRVYFMVAGAGSGWA